MDSFGLLGQNLGHSWSPQIHALLGGYPYGLYEVEPDGLEGFLKTTGLSGMNVTIPYKKAVIPFCASLSEVAKAIGSVNTLLKTEKGWHGDNTDRAGFLTMVSRCGVPVSGKKALVFGSGGASLSVIAALKSLGADLVVNISRTGDNNYDNLSRHADAEILVNATPLGMYPGTGVSPVDLDAFPACGAVLDVVYNPLRTKLIMDAEARGIPREGGLSMLVSQARRSAELFTHKSISEERADEIIGILERRMRNIVLIGMPGCGKSTVGTLAAEKLGRPFFDADAVVEERAGMSIPEIFGREGEAGFRKRETEVLSDLGGRSGAVIATGGGCVTTQENYPLLHQNGVIFWLKRELSLLSSEGRPLSMTVAPSALYEARREKYAAFADYVIENDDTSANTADRITEVFLS